MSFLQMKSIAAAVSGRMLSLYPLCDDIYSTDQHQLPKLACILIPNYFSSSSNLSKHSLASLCKQFKYYTLARKKTKN